MRSQTLVSAALVGAGVVLSLGQPGLAQEARPEPVARSPDDDPAPEDGPEVARPERRPGSPLRAMDRLLPQLIQSAATGVVTIDVERSDYGPRELLPEERQGLGVVSIHDARYFQRPPGPLPGVVIDTDLVATSTWNLGGGTEDDPIYVKTPDGRRLPAERLGSDANTQVTLLRVKGLGVRALPSAPAAPEVGQFLVLVGRGADGRVVATRGLVSGLEREMGDAFTHSARTSYATSGGALVDLRGRLIGLSVRHGDRVRQGQNSGVAFGVELAKLKAPLPRLVAGQDIPRRPTAFMGISVDTALVQRVGEAMPVRINAMILGTGARAAGIKEGDIVKIFNNVEILTFNQLREEIMSLPIGTEIVVTVIRDGEEIDFRVKLGARPAESLLAFPEGWQGPPWRPEDARAWRAQVAEEGLGATDDDATDDDATEDGADQNQDGDEPEERE